MATTTTTTPSSTPTTTTRTRTTVDVSFIITGFGPFRNVKENPTTILVQSLIPYLQQREQQQQQQQSPTQQQDDDVQPRYTTTTSTTTNNSTTTTNEIPMSKRIQTRIIDTAYKAVQTVMDEIYNELIHVPVGTTNTTTTIILHLGVNCNSHQYHIESCAYNEMNCTIPDVYNHQPQQQSCININQPYQYILQSPYSMKSVNVILLHFCHVLNHHNHHHHHHQSPSYPNEITTITTTTTTTKTDTDGTTPILSTTHLRGSDFNMTTSSNQKNQNQNQNSRYGTTCRISTDPGRFVCNYIYYYTLNRFIHPMIRMIDDDHHNKDHHHDVTSTTNVNLTTPSTTTTTTTTASTMTTTTTGTGSIPNVKCLFLHVPPFTVATQIQQLQFLTDFMIVLEQHEQQQLE